MQDTKKMSPKEPHHMSLCLVPRRSGPQRRSAKEHPIISLSSFMFVLRSVKGRARPQHVWKKKPSEASGCAAQPDQALPMETIDAQLRTAATWLRRKKHNNTRSKGLILLMQNLPLFHLVVFRSDRYLTTTGAHPLHMWSGGYFGKEALRGFLFLVRDLHERTLLF